MDRERMSAIAHEGLVFWNPVGDDVVDALLGRLPLPSPPHVLDVGCGRGEMLVRLAVRRGATGLGVDPSSYAVAAARAALKRAGVSEAVRIREDAFDAEALGEERFDLVISTGATHAVGGTTALLAALRPLLRPGGLILLGEGYWRREPDPGYLEVLGAEEDDYRDHAGTEALGAEFDLELVESVVAKRAHWDHYENTWAGNIERHVERHPADPDGPAMLARVRPWREAYLRWGRETLGFGLYVFRAP